MANGIKNAIIQKKIDGIIYDLMVKTNTANVICDDGVTTLSSKISTLVTDLATKLTGADVDARIQEVVGAAPEALNTLEELANALNDDAGFAGALSIHLTSLDTAVASKVDKVAGKGLSTKDFTTVLKTKLEGLTAYTHPSTHPATMIVEDSTHRFTTDAEKATWNNKVDKVTGFGLSTNDYTSAEKTKLAGIATGANNYTHPSTHPASMIVEDSTHRFTLDTEKTTWNTKARVIATATAPADLTENDLFIQIVN